VWDQRSPVPGWSLTARLSPSSPVCWFPCSG
jgi:hypothetical protein